MITIVAPRGAPRYARENTVFVDTLVDAVITNRPDHALSLNRRLCGG